MNLNLIVLKAEGFLMNIGVRRGGFSIKFSYYSISKLLFALYVVYNHALYYTPFYVSKIAYVFLLSSLLVCVFGTKRIIINKYVNYYIAFLTYALITGLLVIVGSGPFIMCIRNLFEYFFSFYLIIAFSKEDGNILFPINTFIFLAIVMSVLNLLLGKGINRITYSDDLNVNAIAAVMMFAIGFVLYCLVQDKNNLFVWIFGIALVALFGYMILITVSKKAIIGASFLILYWALWCSGKDNTKGRIRKTIISILVLFGMYYCYKLFIKYMPTQYSFLLQRMSQLYIGTSSNKRKDLMLQAISVFMEHPIFGVGLNNFRFYTFYNTYSHCFYTELLSCLGICGTVIFFIPFFKGVGSLYRRYRFSTNLVYKNRYKYLLAILACLVATSIAQIIFYEYALIYVVGVLCASEYIDEKSV